jgi:IclR family acetate operon transcriptional repressor
VVNILSEDKDAKRAERGESLKGFRFEALDRAVAILRVLEQGSEPLSLSVIGREVGLGQPTTSRYLASLVGHGLVEKIDGSRYALGIGLFLLGQKSLHRKDVRVVTRPHLEILHRRFDETVSLALCVKGELIVIDCIEGTQALRQGASVGFHNPWHASSLGKSMLAHLPEAEVAELLSGSALEAYTDKTLKSMEEVVRQLPRIREQKFAVDDEESSNGGRCVGASILDASGRPFGAISISGPVARITTENIPEIGTMIADAALEISKAMGYTGHT